MKKLIVVGLVGFLAFSGAVFADGVNWSYIEAGYNNIDIDEIDEIDVGEDGDGFFVGGRFAFSDKWHIVVNYTDSSLDDSDVDITSWYAGAGWHGGLGDKADLFGELAYVDSEAGDLDDSGYLVRAGVRWRPIKLLEVGGGARWEDVGDIQDDMIWEANAMIHIWRLAIGLMYETESDVDQYNIFARFNFGGK